ncbi:hypothetical protein [Paenibacillus spongiae]|uniref:Uncharacterized protein n=1 Tax=Paenibacillus spongiae TaxID=2909671 RepID=A0ABY5S5I9_9BACL|nr:hypothetical protein [Paenibacillus spongiae]UVI28008.1 hypothetical protein L1F29_21440 [Paenibacillus spongiae]
MSYLLPATTMILVALGSLCLFMAMDHDRKNQEIRRRRTAGRPVLVSSVQSPAQTQES